MFPFIFPFILAAVFTFGNIMQCGPAQISSLLPKPYNPSATSLLLACFKPQLNTNSKGPITINTADLQCHPFY